MYKVLMMIGLFYSSCLVHAEQHLAVEDLLKTLKSSPADYEPTPLDRLIDPKILKQSHVVGWVKAPLLDISLKEYRGYLRPVEIRMTVISSTGRIAETQLLRSSGAKAVDTKVMEALSQAILERIPYADANASYVLTQKFAIEKPLE